MNIRQLTTDEIRRLGVSEKILISEHREFIVAPIDKFDIKVESVHNNEEFMTFLDGRSAQKTTILLEEKEKNWDCKSFVRSENA